MFRSLRIRNYRFWFTGAILSSIGTWMQSTTVTWVALTELTDHDAAAVGWTIALQVGPRLFLMPVSGFIADRFDRRRVILITQTLMMILGVTFGLMLLFWHAELWHLYAISLLLGITGAVETPTKQSFIPSLVPEDKLANVVALEAASYNSARLIGPAIAGVLIAVIPVGAVFLINGASFLIVIITLLSLRVADIRQPPPTPKGTGSLMAGVRHILDQPRLVVALVVTWVIGMFALNFSVYVPAMVIEFGGDSGAYGVMSSIMAAGAVTGALTAARVERPTLRRLIIAAAIMGVAAAIGAFAPGYWWFAVVALILGFAHITTTAAVSGFLQSNTPAILRGRVMAILMAVLATGPLIGGPLLGVIINEFGARPAVGIVGGTALAVVAAALVWHHRSKLRPLSRMSA